VRRVRGAGPGAVQILLSGLNQWLLSVLDRSLCLDIRACRAGAMGVDVIFRGDQARSRTGDGPQNIAIIRHTTLCFHVLNQPPASRTGRNVDYLGNRHPSDRLTFKRLPCLGERVDIEPDHIGGF
jgi:hypothetical protein